MEEDSRVTGESAPGARYTGRASGDDEANIKTSFVCWGAGVHAELPQDACACVRVCVSMTKRANTHGNTRGPTPCVGVHDETRKHTDTTKDVTGCSCTPRRGYDSCLPTRRSLPLHDCPCVSQGLARARLLMHHSLGSPMSVCPSMTVFAHASCGTRRPDAWQCLLGMRAVPESPCMHTCIQCLLLLAMHTVSAPPCHASCVSSARLLAKHTGSTVAYSVSCIQCEHAATESFTRVSFTGVHTRGAPNARERSSALDAL